MSSFELSPSWHAARYCTGQHSYAATPMAFEPSNTPRTPFRRSLATSPCACSTENALSSATRSNDHSLSFLSRGRGHGVGVSMWRRGHSFSSEGDVGGVDDRWRIVRCVSSSSSEPEDGKVLDSPKSMSLVKIVPFGFSTNDEIGLRGPSWGGVYSIKCTSLKPVKMSSSISIGFS